MKLLNFSIGHVQVVQVGHEVLKTAHIKAPVAEPWVITENGASGDERAVHPDKLYAFAKTGYDHWGRYLKIDPAKWPDGFFGENLTLDVLDEEDVRVGDVFALGDEVRVIVAGARNPCLKLAWRLAQPRSFQKTFALSRNTGVYLGVVAIGCVRPGDALRRIDHDPTMPSVADVCTFIASHDPPPLEPLKRLLAFHGLSQTNRLLLGAKIDAAERAAAKVEGRWPGWRPFAIDRIVEEAPDIRSFHLKPADGAPICPPRPGQFVSVRMESADGGAIRRSWSLSSFARDMEGYRLTVRRQEGPGSNWLHRAKVGAHVGLRAPTGGFHIDMGGFRPVVLIAAGIGITPLLAMLHAHLTRPQAPAIHLIYGARTPDEAAFRAELDALAAAHPQFGVTYVYSRSDEGARPRSRLTADLAIDLLPELHVVVGERPVEIAWSECDMYICGPGDFCDTLKQAFVVRGGNPDLIAVELFTAPEAGAAGVEEAEVRFLRSGVSARWSEDEDISLLELAEQAGVAVENDCRAGACLSCRTRIVEGGATVTMEDGAALLCIGRPNSALLVLDA